MIGYDYAHAPACHLKPLPRSHPGRRRASAPRRGLGLFHARGDCRPAGRPRPASASRPGAAVAPALAGSLAPTTLAWLSCPASVPLDYDDPGGPRSARRVRRQATDQGPDRTLFFNFGGPGAAGTQVLPVAGAITEAFRARFDIASWDPRGVGESTAVHCFASPEAEFAFLDDMAISLSFPVSSAEMAAWLGRSQSLPSDSNTTC